MITDNNLLVDSSNATVRAAATYLSNNTIDLSVARDMGSGRVLRMMYNVEVAFAGGTSVQPQIITSAAAALTSPTVIDAGVVILEAALVIGATFIRFLPEQVGGVGGLGSVGQRYLGVQYVGVGTHTAGTISARLVLDATDVKHYPGGYTIL